MFPIHIINTTTNTRTAISRSRSRFAFYYSILLLVLLLNNGILIRHVISTVRADDSCSQRFYSLYDESTEIPLTLNYYADANTNQFHCQVIYEGSGWVGFGISKDGFMNGSLAVIGSPAVSPTNNDALGHYRIISIAGSTQIMPLPSYQHTLLNSSLVQNSTHTVLSFIKSLVREDDGDDQLSINIRGSNFFLVAGGFDNYLGYHQYKSSAVVDVSLCVINDDDNDENENNDNEHETTINQQSLFNPNNTATIPPLSTIQQPPTAGTSDTDLIEIVYGSDTDPIPDSNNNDNNNNNDGDDNSNTIPLIPTSINSSSSSDENTAENLINNDAGSDNKNDNDDNNDNTQQSFLVTNNPSTLPPLSIIQQVPTTGTNDKALIEALHGTNTDPISHSNNNNNNNNVSSKPNSITSSSSEENISENLINNDNQQSLSFTNNAATLSPLSTMQQVPSTSTSDNDLIETVYGSITNPISDSNNNNNDDVDDDSNNIAPLVPTGIASSSSEENISENLINNDNDNDNSNKDDGTDTDNKNNSNYDYDDDKDNINGNGNHNGDNDGADSNNNNLPLSSSLDDETIIIEGDDNESSNQAAATVTATGVFSFDTNETLAVAQEKENKKNATSHTMQNDNGSEENAPNSASSSSSSSSTSRFCWNGNRIFSLSILLAFTFCS